MQNISETAKSSVFLDLFQNKSYLLELYKTLHPEEYLLGREKEVVTIMMSLFDEEQIMKSFIRSERHDEARETAERMIKKADFTLFRVKEQSKQPAAAGGKRYRTHGKGKIW